MPARPSKQIRAAKRKQDTGKSRATGNLRIGDHWNAITIIALSQSNPLKAVAELVENSIDARAKAIVITRGKEKGQHYLRVKDDGKPAVVFAAHLANWELPAVIAAMDGLDSVVLYRRPNLGAIADSVIALRKGMMGELVASSLGAPVTLARALEQGRHVAMLVDQHYTRGVDVTFFGRKCKANPLIAMLAREVECPIHGTRVIRLPGNRFRGEISDEIKPVRDPNGRIDVQGTMQAITTVIEGWVREHPEQWLWLHRRWR